MESGEATALLCSVVEHLSPGVFGLAKLAKPFTDLLYQLSRALLNAPSEVAATAAARALAALAADSHAKGREADTAVRKVVQVRVMGKKRRGRVCKSRR